MSDAPFLSVVIPSYNEEKNLQRKVLDEVYRYLKTLKFDWELILSDDGSTDGTTEKLQDFAQGKSHVHVVANHHAGKAPTVVAGMLAARGQYRLFTDFDQSTPIQTVEKSLEWASQGFDIVIASREIHGALRDKEPIHRHIMGKGFNFFVQILAVRGIHDTQCGFKLFSAEATQDLFSKLVIYGSNQPRKDAFTGAFDVELLFLARKKGYKVKEMPVEWSAHESDRVSPVKDSLRMFRDILRIRAAWLTGQYGKGKSEE